MARLAHDHPRRCVGRRRPHRPSARFLGRLEVAASLVDAALLAAARHGVQRTRMVGRFCTWVHLCPPWLSRVIVAVRLALGRAGGLAFDAEPAAELGAELDRALDRCRGRRSWSRARTASMRAWSSTEATRGVSPFRAVAGGRGGGGRHSRGCRAARGRASARPGRFASSSTGRPAGVALHRRLVAVLGRALRSVRASPRRRRLFLCVEGQMSTPLVVSPEPCSTRPTPRSPRRRPDAAPRCKQHLGSNRSSVGSRPPRRASSIARRRSCGVLRISSRNRASSLASGGWYSTTADRGRSRRPAAPPAASPGSASPRRAPSERSAPDPSPSAPPTPPATTPPASAPAASTSHSSHPDPTTSLRKRAPLTDLIHSIDGAESRRAPAGARGPTA